MGSIEGEKKISREKKKQDGGSATLWERGTNAACSGSQFSRSILCSVRNVKGGNQKKIVFWGFVGSPEYKGIRGTRLKVNMTGLQENGREKPYKILRQHRGGELPG